MLERFDEKPQKEENKLLGTPEEHIEKVIGILNSKGKEVIPKLSAEDIKIELYKLHGFDRTDVRHWHGDTDKAETDEDRVKIESANAAWDKMTKTYPDELIERKVSELYPNYLENLKGKMVFGHLSGGRKVAYFVDEPSNTKELISEGDYTVVLNGRKFKVEPTEEINTEKFEDVTCKLIPLQD